MLRRYSHFILFRAFSKVTVVEFSCIMPYCMFKTESIRTSKPAHLAGAEMLAQSQRWYCLL